MLRDLGILQKGVDSQTAALEGLSPTESIRETQPSEKSLKGIHSSHWVVVHLCEIFCVMNYFDSF